MTSVHERRWSIASLVNSTCPNSNTADLDSSRFWADGRLNWEPHRVGWAAAGVCALVTTLIAGVNIWRHCRNYRRPLAQRQVVRILLMPSIFAIISFVGYREFRHFTYYEVVRDAYESFTMAAFMSLILLFVSDSPIEQREALVQKGKRKLVFPFCCWRFRPGKPAFLWVVKWSVLQFVIIKPLLSITSVLTEALGVLCPTSQSFRFANVYIEIVDFFCVSVALYGLIVLYATIHPELSGHRPLAKFMTIKIIVAWVLTSLERGGAATHLFNSLVFYQSFIFSILEYYGVIKDTQYWTAGNISEGLNALVTTVEMVLIALYQLYAYPASEFKPAIKDDRSHTSFWRSFLHSQNYSDFAIDIYLSLKFFVDRLRGKAYTKSKPLTSSGPTDTTEKGYANPDAFGNGYDLVGAFNFHADAFPAPEGPTGRPIDAQRPYIAPASWGATHNPFEEDEFGDEKNASSYALTSVRSGGHEDPFASHVHLMNEGQDGSRYGAGLHGGYAKVDEH